jgi:hypothetical protein
MGVVHETEEHRQRFFQMGQRVGMLGSSHPRVLSPRVQMAPVVSSIHATHIQQAVRLPRLTQVRAHQDRFERLDNMRFCVESVLGDRVPGDLV